MKTIFLSTFLLVNWTAISASAIEQSGFVPNNGEAPASVKFLGRVEHFVAEFADDAVTLAGAPGSIRVSFSGENPQSVVSPDGNELLYRNTWPGIDIEYASHLQTLKSEYHVSPGSDPNLIRLRYEGENVSLGRPAILADGSLRIAVGAAQFVDSPPYAYQEKGNGVRVPVQAAYSIQEDGTVGFVVGSYDPALPLIIDPVINYSTLFGGSGDLSVTSVAVDAYGNAVVAGWTTATDLPTNGARKTNGGGVDAFVAKLSAEGNQVIWCTYLGGNGDDRAFGVTLDASGNVYVTGWTSSSNFPVAGAIQTKSGGGRDAFVTKLNASGTTILYSTYLGGSNYDQGNAITVDSSGSAYITGDTSSTNFPVLNAYQATSHGQQDAFIAKLSPAGNSLIFSTYVGGSGADHGAAIALDSANNIYITGSTYSSNFPVVSATQARIGGGEDAFAVELSSNGNSLIFGTYIGGSGGTPGLAESGNAIAVDVSGNLYVAGSTSSIDFPTTTGAYQRTLTNGGADDHGFVWKLKNDKSQILYSTYLAGMNLDVVNGMAVDPAGNAYIVGSTSSTDFPIVRPFQSGIPGLTNAFVLKLNSAGSGLIFGSFLGGSSSDAANAVAVDSKQNIIIGGITQSTDFPLLNPAQAYTNASSSGFISRVVSGWYATTFANGAWYTDTWHDGGWDGSSYTSAYSAFGQAGDLPIVGDWTGTGTTKLGVFRNGLWILDSNANGRIDSNDLQFTFGQAGDVPIIGDWDGSGYLKAGLFRKGMFILDLSPLGTGVGTGKQISPFYFGNSTDIPVTADWGNTGVTKVGVFRSGTWYICPKNAPDISGYQSFVYGIKGDSPLIGDWDGSGTAKVGVSRGGYWILNVAGDRQFHGSQDTQFYFGSSSFSFLVSH